MTCSFCVPDRLPELRRPAGGRLDDPAITHGVDVSDGDLLVRAIAPRGWVAAKLSALVQLDTYLIAFADDVGEIQPRRPFLRQQVVGSSLHKQ
jgi:hypothetical protein